MGDNRYFIHKTTGSLHTCEKGSIFDKERSKSSEWKGFNSDKERAEYVRRQGQKNGR